MTKSYYNAQQLNRRLATIRLPDRVKHQVRDYFAFWCRNNGPEWAVGHLKDIKVALMQFIASKRLPQDLWLRKKTKSKWHGVFGWLQKHATGSKRNLRAVLQLLNIYTAVVAEKVTPKQKRKFLTSVTESRNPVPAEIVDRLKCAVRHAFKRYGMRRIKLGAPRPLLHSAKRKLSHEMRMVPEVDEFFSSNRGAKMRVEHRKWVRPALGWLEGKQLISNDVDPTVGKVLVSQEPGYKARFYAAPHLWIQQALDPLKKGLSSLLAVLPWDGTHNQSVADEKILRTIRSKEQVFCFDLSDATNVFPLELQLAVLEEALDPAALDVIDLFVEVVKSSWDFDGGRIEWARGQALGLGPSFALFAATHGLALYLLNGCKHEHKFYVVGDDVVILCPLLAERYVGFLNDVDVPWSRPKTLVSDQIAEFTGWIFTSEGKFQVPKYKLDSTRGILDVLRNTGPEMISYFPEHEREFLQWYTSLPEPIGFGWNPKGLSLDQRLSPAVIEVIEEGFFSTRPTLYDVDVAKRIEDRVNALPDEMPNKQFYIRFLNRSGATDPVLQPAREEEAEILSVLARYNSKLIGLPKASLKQVLSQATSEGIYVDLPPERLERFIYGERLPAMKKLRRRFDEAFTLWKQTYEFDRESSPPVSVVGPSTANE